MPCMEAERVWTRGRAWRSRVERAKVGTETETDSECVDVGKREEAYAKKAGNEESAGWRQSESERRGQRRETEAATREEKGVHSHHDLGHSSDGQGNTLLCLDILAGWVDRHDIQRHLLHVVAEPPRALALPNHLGLPSDHEHSGAEVGRVV